MIKDYKKNEYYIKFLVYLFIASAYSSQLIFTTLCTPIMFRSLLGKWIFLYKHISISIVSIN
ncbi:hypothetical protein BpHYR1_037621 [Brachionus plicatilis]|uniref:Uncharacterized protein n=1 Tax=Brachionus plicatilis TaxID=10195 RepID=A0A3M7P553_BRAPC|nr:hypothetical protein BpHYR1_037621 [Brachionus plicatilis]